jgi:hypothetical protein
MDTKLKAVENDMFRCSKHHIIVFKKVGVCSLCKEEEINEGIDLQGLRGEHLEDSEHHRIQNV